MKKIIGQSAVASELVSDAALDTRASHVNVDT